MSYAFAIGGRVVQQSYCTLEDAQAIAEMLEAVAVEVPADLDDPLGCYLDESDELLQRPVLPISHNANHFTNVPEGTAVTVTGPANAQDTITGGMLELDFDLPGVYEIRFALFPYLDLVVSHEA